MKKSKIILISLLSAIALLILAAFIDIRVNGNGRGHKNISVHKQTIPSFKVLYINHTDNLDIIQSDSSYIEISCMKDTLIRNKPFIDKGDTLIVSNTKSYNSVKIFFKDTLRSIHLKNSDITIKRFNYPVLTLNTDRSYVLFDLNKDDKYFINSLNIKAKNHSTINSSDLKVDLLNIDLKTSEAYLRTKSKKISGVLSDSSRVFVYQLEEISMKKDTTSKIYFYD